MVNSCTYYTTFRCDVQSQRPFVVAPRGPRLAQRRAVETLFHRSRGVEDSRVKRLHMHLCDPPRKRPVLRFHRRREEPPSQSAGCRSPASQGLGPAAPLPRRSCKTSVTSSANATSATRWSLPSSSRRERQQSRLPGMARHLCQRPGGQRRPRSTDSPCPHADHSRAKPPPTRSRQGGHRLSGSPAR